MQLVRFFFFYVLMSSSFFAIAGNENVQVVLHVNDDFKLSYLENSVKSIRQDMGDDVEIQVVINGKAVTRMLRSNEVSKKIVQNVLKLNAAISVCHNALNNNNVTPDMLIEGLNVLKTDGNVAIINYQRKGYLYIKI